MNGRRDLNQVFSKIRTSKQTGPASLVHDPIVNAQRVEIDRSRQKRGHRIGAVEVSAVQSRQSVGGGLLPRRVAGEATLASFEELLRPAVMEALGDPLAPAQFGDRVFAPKTGHDDPDLILG